MNMPRDIIRYMSISVLQFYRNSRTNVADRHTHGPTDGGSTFVSNYMTNLVCFQRITVSVVLRNKGTQYRQKVAFKELKTS